MYQGQIQGGYTGGGEQALKVGDVQAPNRTMVSRSGASVGAQGESSRILSIDRGGNHAIHAKINRIY